MTSSTTIRLGTRGSKLAMWQSTWVKQALEGLGCSVELIQIKTEGDVATGSLSQIGGQGLFTKRLQIALQNKEVDLAVHSLKDLPTQDAQGLSICAIPQRETTADALVSNEYESLQDLPSDAVVGTGSVRRAAQILHLRSDLKIADIRGNVDTRLRKLDEGDYDAIVLAAAGLTRLGWQDRITSCFSPDELLPAVGQGALGLETRTDDGQANAIVSQLNHVDSFSSAMAERHMLRALFAGCLAPVGAVTEVNEQMLTLTGVVLSTDGQTRVEVSESSSLDQYAALGQSVAKELVDKGADKLLKSAQA